MPKLIAIVTLLPLIACLICGCASHSASGSGGSSHSSGNTSGAGVAPANSGESVEERPLDESVPEWVSIFPQTLGPDSTLIVSFGFKNPTLGFAQWDVTYALTHLVGGATANKDDILVTVDNDDAKAPDLSPNEITRTSPVQGLSFLITSRPGLEYDYVLKLKVTPKEPGGTGMRSTILIHQ